VIIAGTAATSNRVSHRSRKLAHLALLVQANFEGLATVRDSATEFGRLAVRSISLCSIVVVLAVAVAGCAESGTPTPSATPAGSTSAPTPDASAPAPAEGASTSPAIPAPDYRGQAERAVRAYYRAIDESDFSAAWSRLTSPVQAALGGYSKWKSGFDTSISTRVLSAIALDAGQSHANVEVRLKSVDVDACASNVTQGFTGVWRLQRTGGRWMAASVLMRKTSGATPVADVTQCPGATGDSGDVCDPTSAAYDQGACDDQSGGSDSGDPCDPNSTAYDAASCGGGGTDQSFCNSHECIDNFDNGTGYIVQCNDGEWSHSGGRPGACSDHEGESDVTGP
jgi:hypothetical protein